MTYIHATFGHQRYESGVCGARKVSDLIVVSRLRAASVAKLAFSNRVTAKTDLRDECHKHDSKGVTGPRTSSEKYVRCHYIYSPHQERRAERVLFQKQGSAVGSAPALSTAFITTTSSARCRSADVHKVDSSTLSRPALILVHRPRSPSSRAPPKVSIGRKRLPPASIKWRHFGNARRNVHVAHDGRARITCIHSIPSPANAPRRRSWGFL